MSTIVRNGSRISTSTCWNSSGVRMWGVLRRLLPPFTRTSLIGFLSTNSKLGALVNRVHKAPNVASGFGADSNRFYQSSTAIGAILSTGTSAHRGRICLRMYDS